MESNWRYGVWYLGLSAEGVRLAARYSATIGPERWVLGWEDDYERCTTCIRRPDGSLDSFQEIWLPALGTRFPYHQTVEPD